MNIIPIESDEHWHSLRAKHIGSSDVAALFDESPYFSKFALWHDRAGKAAMPRREDERMDAGKFLEDGIANMVTHQMRWNLEKRRVYLTHDEVPGMGATLDRFIVDNEDGPGALEIKNVDWLVWKQQWSETVAPFHIEVQLQHQLEITKYDWGAIACLVGGNDLRIYLRRRIPQVTDEIAARIAGFWDSIKRDEPPAPFGNADEIKTLAMLYPTIVKDKVLEIPPEEMEVFRTMCAQFAWAQQQRKFHANEEERLKTLLVGKMQDCQFARVPGMKKVALRKSPVAATVMERKAYTQTVLTVEVAEGEAVAPEYESPTTNPLAV